MSWRRVKIRRRGARHFQQDLGVGGSTVRVAGLVDEDDDSYAQNLLRIVPVESIALFITIDRILAGSKPPGAETISWVIIGLLLPLTFAYILRTTRDELGRLGWLQASVTTVVFIAWAYGIGGPFATLKWYHPTYGALVLAAVNGIGPLIMRISKEY